MRTPIRSTSGNEETSMAAKEATTRTRTRSRSRGTREGVTTHRAGKVIQINLNNSRGAMDLLRVTATEIGAGIAIVSEPPKAMGVGRWYASTDTKAIIMILDRDLPARRIGGGKGWVTALVGDTEYTSCYFSPNTTTREFVQFLTELRRHQPKKDESGKRGARGRRIIAGDLNATRVGRQKRRRKGEEA